MAKMVLMLTGVLLVPLIGAAIPNPYYTKDVSRLFLNSLDDLERRLNDPALENKPFIKLRALTTKVLDLTESVLVAKRRAGDNSTPTIVQLLNVRSYRSALPQIFGPLEHLVMDQRYTEAQKYLNSPAFTGPIFKNLKSALKIASSADRDRILQRIKILSGLSGGSFDSVPDPLKCPKLSVPNQNNTKDMSRLFLDSLDELERGLTDPALENKPFVKLHALTSKVLDLTECALVARRQAGDNSTPTFVQLNSIKVYRSTLPQIFGPLERLVIDQTPTEAQKYLNSPAFTNIVFKNLRNALKIASSADRDKIIERIKSLSGLSGGYLDSDPLKSQQLPFTHIRIPQF